MLKAAIKNLLGHKLRMFLTGFSIILGVSFVAGTYIFTDSISTTFNNLFSDVFSGVDVTIRPKTEELGESVQSFSGEILDEVSKIEGVSVTDPWVNGYAQYLDKNGEPVGGQGPPTLGFSWGVEEGLNSLKIADGDGQAPTKAGEVVVDKATASANDFKVGDTVKILLSGPAEEFKIVGIATFGSAEGVGGATIAAFELTEAQRIFGFAPNTFSGIDIKATNDVSSDELKSRIDQILPDNLEAVTGQQQSNEQLDDINQGLGFVNTALLAFAGISIFVGSYIIQNTFRITVSQRSKELALLRAIGATKTQVIRLVVYEAFGIAVLASTVGIGFGFVISIMVRSIMNSFGFALPNGDLTLQPRTVAISYAVGVIVTVLAALLPAIKASRVSPIEAMRENEAGDKDIKSLFKRGLSGGIIMIIGGASLIYGLGGSADKPLYPVGLGVTLLFIGVSIIAPLLSSPLARIIGWPLTRTRGTPARLARDNARRTPRRTASSAAALMIGVSLVTMLSILATSFKAQITTILDESFPADITISSNNIGEAGPGTASFSVATYETLKKTPELKNVTALRYGFQAAKVDGKILDFIVGVDAETFGNMIKLDETEGAYENVTRGQLLIAKKAADEKGWSIGDSVELEFAKTGKQSFIIGGTFNEAYDSDYIISTQSYLKNFTSDDVTLIIANANDGFSPTDAKTAAETALAGYAQLSIQDKGDLFETANQQIDQVLGLFWALLAFAINIAVLGITNTLMLSISERTKEIGMLRAIGMTRSQVRRMIRYESIIIALFGAVLGVTMGLFFAWTLIRALESEGFTQFAVPYGQIVLYFFLAILAGIFAAAWPARKAARMDVLKAIYHD